MAVNKTVKTTKKLNSNKGFKSTTLSDRKVRRNDLKAQKIAADKEVKLRKLDVAEKLANNPSYQKQQTARVLGAEIASGVATPATASVVNTQSYASGGFNDPSATKDKESDNDSEISSGGL